ncbi:MAG: hypothetical protein ACRDMZ_09150, partial [Solirubrobacteraceae bacterium]
MRLVAGQWRIGFTAANAGLLGAAYGRRVASSPAPTDEERSMPHNPPEGYTRITPYLLYEDAAAAIDFLT